MGNPDIAPADFAHDPTRMPVAGLRRHAPTELPLQFQCGFVSSLTFEDFWDNPDGATEERDVKESQERAERYEQIINPYINQN